MDLEKRHLKIVKNILKQASNVSFFAFGSRVNNTAKKFSDLDICYKGEMPRSLLLKIKSDFYESDLPFKIDILAYNKIPEGYLPDIRLAPL